MKREFMVITGVLAILAVIISSFVLILFFIINSPQAESGQDIRLICKVESDKPVYIANETIQISITVSNPTSSPITITFGDSQTGAYEIRLDSTLLYTGPDRGSLPVETYVTIQAHDSFVQTFLHSKNDYPLQPRYYTIRGVISDYEYFLTNDTTIQVVR